jgi:hypothetical protein
VLRYADERQCGGVLGRWNHFGSRSEVCRPEALATPTKLDATLRIGAFCCRIQVGPSEPSPTRGITPEIFGYLQSWMAAKEWLQQVLEYCVHGLSDAESHVIFLFARKPPQAFDESLIERIHCFETRVPKSKRACDI